MNDTANNCFVPDGRTDLLKVDDEVRPVNGDDVAIIGVSIQCPQVSNVDEFWNVIVEGKSVVSEVLNDGLDKEKFVFKSHIIDGIDCFDKKAFNLSMNEAELMDPQLRLLLQNSWHALESAGIFSQRSKRIIGSFTSIDSSQYLLNNILKSSKYDSSNKLIQFGNDPHFTATQIAYRLNLCGPAYTTLSACSSSLNATCNAVNSLRLHQCDYALVGASSISKNHDKPYAYQVGGILSRSGQCSPFDTDADGTVSGSGVAVIVLQRLSDALNEKRNIYAVIKSVATNNDGSSKQSFAAPSKSGQTEAIYAALINAGLDPSEIIFHEAHGTGTRIGDPIEISAFMSARSAVRECSATSFSDIKSIEGGCRQSTFIGGLKANFGHMGATAGLASLIKSSLVLEEGIIPPLANFTQLNNDIEDKQELNFPKSAIKIKEDKAHFASVSSMGMGGSNVHIIIGKASGRRDHGTKIKYHVLPVSNNTADGVEAGLEEVRMHVGGFTPVQLADLAHTLINGRDQYGHRLCLVKRDNWEKTVKPVLNPEETPRLVFLISGQSSRIWRVSECLYKYESSYREAFDHCIEMLPEPFASKLKEILLGSVEKNDAYDTQMQQCGVFVHAYSSAFYWNFYGITANTVLGHSIGEYVAACLAGIFTLEDTISIVYARGEMMRTLPVGKMFVVPASKEQLAAITDSFDGQDYDLYISSELSNERCVVAANEAGISLLLGHPYFVDKKITKLNTGHYFHTPILGATPESFGEIFENLHGDLTHKVSISYYSNLTGGLADINEAKTAEYWYKHSCKPALIRQNIDHLLSTNANIFIDLGPGQQLSSLLMLDYGINRSSVFSCDSYYETEDAHQESKHLQLSSLWVNGVSVDLIRLYENEERYYVDAPKYVFQKEKCWLDSNDNISIKNKFDVSQPVTSANKYGFYKSVWMDIVPHQFQLKGNAELKQSNCPNVKMKIDYDRAGQKLEIQVFLNGEYLGSFSDYSECIDYCKNKVVEMSEALELYMDYAQVSLCDSSKCESHLSDKSSNWSQVLLLLDNASNVFKELCPVKLTIVLNNKPRSGLKRYYKQALELGFMVACQENNLNDWRIITQSDDSHNDTSREFRYLPAGYHYSSNCDGVLQRVYVKTESVISGDYILEDGVYLVTGANGEVAQDLLEWMDSKAEENGLTIEVVAQYRRHNDRLLNTVRSLNNIKVKQLKVDLLFESEVKSAIDHIQEEIGLLSGIFHLASISEGKMLSFLNTEFHEKCMRVKLNSVQMILQACDQSNLQFCLIFSSINAIAGGAGRFSYAMANAAVNDLAITAQRDFSTIDIKTLVLPSWQNLLIGGIAANETGQVANNKLGFLDAVLNSQERMFIIDDDSLLDLNEKRNRRNIDQRIKSIKQVEGIKLTEKGSSRENNNQYVHTSQQIGEKISQIWCANLGLDMALDDDNFYAHGGTSLQLIRIGSEISECLGVELKAERVFAITTLQSLKELACEAVELDQTLASTHKAESSINTSDLRNVLDDFSLEELEFLNNALENKGGMDEWEA